MSKIRLMLAGLESLVLFSAAEAQQDKMAPNGTGEATIYRDVGFEGPAVYIARATTDLGLTWPVRSVRVKKGLWEICSRTNYRGRCVQVAADDPDIRGRTGFFDTVKSMRPLGGPQIQPPLPPQPPTPPAGTSLRGMSAEFFPAPGTNGYRMLSCANGGSTANCAAKTADTFCRSVGWNGSKTETQETINGRVYLADVLCVRSGF